ncbi:GAF domain-containing protein [Sodalinema gerasimenkoae]|uniref:GAF domain-containing protein n=1 Tax=Sodalinema gerasimenkoae TaxID=2862348 RepID=UPI001CA4AD06|nr:GAF domain-containing protein [Sodalinema gerasimenkoae]
MPEASCAFDEHPNEAFKDLARLATYICHAPVAAIVFSNGRRQGVDAASAGQYRCWIKAALGLPPERFALCIDLCEVTLERDRLTVIEDLSQETPFRDRPFIKSYPHYRFYCGIPLVSPKGTTVGTLCVLDNEPRQLDLNQRKALATLSRQATRSLRALRDFGTYFQRPAWQDMGHYVSPVPLTDHPYHVPLPVPSSSPSAADEAKAKFSQDETPNRFSILETITEAFFAVDRQWQLLYINRRAEKLWNINRSEVINTNLWETFPDLIQSVFAQECHAAFDNQSCRHFEEYYEPLGIWLEVRLHPELQRLSIYFRDVTQYKKNETVLLEQSHLASLVSAVSSALAQSQTLDESLDRSISALLNHLQASTVGIWLVQADDPDTTTFDRTDKPLTLVEQSTAGDTLPELLFPKTTFLGDSLLGWVAETREPYINNRLDGIAKAWATDPAFKPSGLDHSVLDLERLGAWAEEHEIQGLVLYPLIVEERLLGVLLISAPHSWTEDAVGVLDWLSSTIGLSVDRAWAREALVNRRKSLLFRLAGQIRNSLDLDTILDTAVHEIRALLQIDRCYYLWCSGQGESPLTLAVTHEACGKDIPSFLGESFMSQADRLVPKIWQLETVQLNDLTQADEETRDFLEPLDVKAQLILPLGTRSGQFGAIACSHGNRRTWNDTEVELLQAVVDQLAIAIDQAELYAKTCAAALAAQTQARQLQEAMEHLKQTEAQLIQHEKMSSLGQMVAGIAHEINNPVNFITGNISHASTYVEDLLGLIDLYQRHIPNPPEEIEDEIEDIDLEFVEEDLPKLIDSMKMGAERIRQIVVSLRNFSRLDEADVKAVDIHEGIESTLLILHNRLKGKGELAPIRLIKYYGDLPKVNCFPGLLNQVFMNIIANAIDAVEDAGLRASQSPETPTITICTEKTCSGSTPEDPTCTEPDSVTIRIRDNGPGIKSQMLEKLFDPFFTTKSVGKGTGLGLSIGYQIIVEKHRGRIWCESEPGKGTEFLMQIPLHQPEFDL